VRERIIIKACRPIGDGLLMGGGDDVDELSGAWAKALPRLRAWEWGMVGLAVLVGGREMISEAVVELEAEGAGSTVELMDVDGKVGGREKSAGSSDGARVMLTTGEVGAGGGANGRTTELDVERTVAADSCCGARTDRDCDAGSRDDDTRAKSERIIEADVADSCCGARIDRDCDAGSGDDDTRANSERIIEADVAAGGC
jgi:hypothetical protein